MESGMERVGTILEREGEALESLLFKLIETRLLIEADEARFLPRATREVDRAKARARELDLLRAATVAQIGPGATLRQLAATCGGPWPAILRDHHDLLSRLVSEIEMVAHHNSVIARNAIEALTCVPAGMTAQSPISGRPIRNADLDRLARGAALDAVMGTATRLQMPDLLDFLR